MLTGLVKNGEWSGIEIWQSIDSPRNLLQCFNAPAAGSGQAGERVFIWRSRCHAERQEQHCAAILKGGYVYLVFRSH